jgi:hypothetical protein
LGAYAAHLVKNTWGGIVNSLLENKETPGPFARNALNLAANCTELNALSASFDAAIQAAEAYQQQNEMG